MSGILFSTWSQKADMPRNLNPENIPDEVRTCMKTKPEIELNSDINPFLISGDFDGDGFTDFAVQVRSKRDQRHGVLICFAKREAVLVAAGAPAPWFQGSRDPWHFDSWFLVPKGSKQLSIYPQIKFDALALLIADEGGGLLYWDEHKFRWQQEE
jgi:hypothetical protein